MSLTMRQRRYYPQTLRATWGEFFEPGGENVSALLISAHSTPKNEKRKKKEKIVKDRVFLRLLWKKT